MIMRSKTFQLLVPCVFILTLLGAHAPDAATNEKITEKESIPAKGGSETTSEEKGSTVEGNGPAARVNGVEISMRMLQKTFERQLEERGIDVRKIESRERYNELRMEVLDALIDQELLWQEAQGKKIIAKDEEVETAIATVARGMPFEEAFAAILEEGGFTEETYREFMRAQISVSRLIETEVAPGISVSDGEIHDYYTENPVLFTRPEEVRARQILVKTEEGAGEAARKEAKKKIEEILEEAKGGSDFARLARERSEDPSGPRGGDLGFFSRGKMPGPIEDAVFAMKPGDISDVVETPFGYHIIKLEARRGGDIIPEDQVREKIRRNLTRRKIREAVQRRVKKLREKATVEILIPKNGK